MRGGLTLLHARKAHDGSTATQSRAQGRDGPRKTASSDAAAGACWVWLSLDPRPPETPRLCQSARSLCVFCFIGCLVFLLPANATAQTKMLLFCALALHVGSSV